MPLLEPAVPLHLRAPQDVLLLVHEHGEVLVLALLDGVGASGDGSHFAELQEAQAGQAGVGWSSQPSEPPPCAPGSLGLLVTALEPPCCPFRSTPLSP